MLNFIQLWQFPQPGTMTMTKTTAFSISSLRTQIPNEASGICYNSRSKCWMSEN